MPKSPNFLPESERFRHIYVEEAALEYPATREIMAKLPGASIIQVRNYLEVFGRANQNFRLQKRFQNLILAVKHDTRVYAGPPYCQNFGSGRFFYSSSVLNCLYDCDYCFLQGMFPSANLTVFVNLEDYLRDAELIVREGPAMLALSYDTDLLALEGLLGFTEKWVRFAENHPELTLEIRTKSANFHFIRHLKPLQSVVLAWTMLPDEISQSLEKGCASIDNRIQSAFEALDAGWPVRLCFDPVLPFPDFEVGYKNLLERIFNILPPDSIRDASVGNFRMNPRYLKTIRRLACCPESPECIAVRRPSERQTRKCRLHTSESRRS